MARKDIHNFLFNRFPVVPYDVSGTGDVIEVKNLLRHFAFRQDILDNTGFYMSWIIRDQDTPQVIAHKLYGSTYHYWIVLMGNLMVDPLWDWPLTDKHLKAYCDRKYGSTITDLHHYEALEPNIPNEYPVGTVVDASYASKQLISNYEYELRANEEKRKIKLIRPEYLGRILAMKKEILDTKFSSRRK